MEQLLEEIIYELLNCRVLKYKRIGIQLAKEFSKKKIDFTKRNKKIELLKEKLFLILLENISDNMAVIVQNNTILIKALSERIKKCTGWIMSNNGDFHKKDYKYSYSILRNEDGYHLHPRKNYDLGKIEAMFFINYQAELNVIHNAMTENERILSAIPCFNKGKVSDKLLSLIISFIDHKEEIKEVKYIYQKNRNK